MKWQSKCSVSAAPRRARVSGLSIVIMWKLRNKCLGVALDISSSFNCDSVTGNKPNSNFVYDDGL